MAIATFIVVFISLWFSMKSDCSYVDIKAGFGFPTDTCVIRTTDDGNSSTLFHCTNSGIETHQFNNYNCDGIPLTKTPPSDSMIREYDYQCGAGANNSPTQCNTATLKINACNTGTITLIFITNKCFNVENHSFRAQCNGNNDGNIFKYNALDCKGTAIKYDFFDVNSWNYTSTYSPNCNQLYWQCNTDINNTTASVESAHWNTQLVAVIIAGILICLLITIICSYCCFCRTKKPNMNNKSEPLMQNNYVAMNNMPYIDPHQSNNSRISNPLTATNTSQVIQVIQYDDVVPSAPKMSSINNEQYEQLPQGWSKAVTQAGKVYYQNDITKQTQWEKPTKTTYLTAEGPDLNRAETNGVEGGGVMNLMDNKEYGGVVNFFNERVCLVDDEDTHKYIKLFVLNGYETSFKISQLTDQQLIDIGVDKIGHRRKILEEASKI